MEKTKGFTLVELMITMTVIVILMVAAPSFVTIIKNNRQTLNVNTLLMSMNAARDEAIKRNGAVTVCQSADGEDCTDGGWHEGWLIFEDDGTAGQVDDGDTIIKVFPAVAEETSLTSTAFDDFIAFDSDGTSSSAGSFTICDDRGAAHGVSLCVAATGRITSAYDNCAGEEIECP